MTLNELVHAAHENSRAKGWWEGDSHNVPEKLMLIVSELAEALEDYRNGNMVTEMEPPYRVGAAKPVGFPTELADAVIRIGDLCGFLGIDLDAVVRQKMAYNATRPHRHGGKRA